MEHAQMTSRSHAEGRDKRRLSTALLVVAALLGAAVASIPTVSSAATVAPSQAHASASALAAPANNAQQRGKQRAKPLTASQLAIRDCSATSAFVNIAGQGPICSSNGSHVLRFAGGREKTISAPDRISALVRTRAHVAHAATAALSSTQCVDPTQHTHVELYYAHFSDQPDNYASHVADIQQMFRDVDANYLNYDATTYFGIGIHMFVECDGSLNPVVHDIVLSSPLGNSNFSSIVTDMSNQGHNSNLAHYWIWTDGNPLAAYGYAGQSTIEQDDSASGGNLINGSYEYSINYGFAGSGSGAQVFAHENGHAMGAVQLSAPHSTGRWHCTDGLDVMCYNDGGPNGSKYASTSCGAAPNGALFFDCNFNDYFNPGPAAGSYLDTHWNLASPNNHWVSMQVAASNTALGLSTASPVYSQPETLTATVHGPGAPQPGTPTGTVTFFDSSSPLGTVGLDASGIARLTPAVLTLGSHSITASYSGSAVYTGSTTGASSLTVSQAQSATGLSTSANPAPAGGSVTITAAITPVGPATGTPTGSATFFDGSTQLGSAALDGGGNASISRTLTYGTHQLSATYAGDVNFGPSDNSASPYTETVLNPSVTGIGSSAGQNTAEVGTAVTFSAQVTPGAGTPGGQAPPTGSITFKDGSTSISSALSLGSGNQATFTTSGLTPGTHRITAVYSGDAAYVPSTGALTETVTTFASLYALDGYGGMHPVSSPNLPDKPASWPGWDIARGIVLRADGQSGYVLDGWGGVHPFGGAPSVAMSAYWTSWDIARGIVLRADGQSGYVLDGWGGIHPFGGAPSVTTSAYWSGWDIARGIVLRADGQSGYVLDGWGGIHPFGGAPAVHTTAFWRGWDIGRAIALDPDGAGGYVLDGWGGVHPFGNAPPVTGSAFWRGWDIARSLVLLPGGLHMGYVQDGWGGLHAFGGAPALAVPTSAFFPGRDVGRGIATT
jgi:hypothetical protein